MPSTKKPRRHSRIKSSNSLSRQLAGLGRTIRESFQGNWRQHRLRSQRKRRLRSNPPAEQQLLALRRFLQFRWLQRRLQRSPRDPQQPRNLTPWLWSRASGSLSTRDAAALLLRHSAAALVLLILISLALNAIPLQLTSPNWYVQVLAYIAENVPALLLASGFATLSLLLAGNSDVSNTYRSRLLRLSRLGYILALLLLPLQLAFTAWLFGQTYTAQRTQLSAIRANAEALIAGAQQTTTTEQFVAYLRSRNLSGNLESIAAAPLIQVKTEFIRSVKNTQQEQEQSLAGATRSTMLRYTTNSIKLFFTLLVLAGFMRSFQALLRRCQPLINLPAEPSEAIVSIPAP